MIDKNGEILGTGMCNYPMNNNNNGTNKAESRDNNNNGPMPEPKMYYSIPLLAAQDNVKLVVTNQNYPPFVKTTSLPGTLNVDMDSDVGPGAGITGAVHDSAGKAVGNAVVKLTGRLSNRSVITGTDGTYSMPGLAPGVYRFLVSGEGYALEAQKIVVYSKDQILNFTLSPCAGSISGTVYAQKFPYPLVAPGAPVVAYDDTANGQDPAKEIAVYETITDNSGAYKISPVVEGHTYKVALAVPGKTVQIYSPSPSVPQIAGSALTEIDFIYKSRPPNVKLIARPAADGIGVTLQGESPRKLDSLTAKYNEGTAYDANTAAALTVTPIGMKTYTITLPYKTRAYAVRFTVDDGAAVQDLDFLYNPNNKAQAKEDIDQKSVTSGDVVLDSQGNDTSGIFISPGSITLADGSIPEISIDKEKQESSSFTSGVPANEVGGDVYSINLKMDGSQQNDSKTMTLTVGYDTTLVGDKTSQLSVQQYNETTKTWEPILGAPTVDPISGTVSIEVDNIASAAASSASPRKKPSMAQFNGKEYKLAPSRAGAATSNQKGIFMVSKVPARVSYSGATLEVFNTPNPFDLNQKIVSLNRGGSIAQIKTNGTVIRFSVPLSCGNDVKTRFRIYNIAGELVRELNASDMLAGGVNGGYYYYLEWDGNNTGGSKCASGVYICMAEVGNLKTSIKMALIK